MKEYDVQCYMLKVLMGGTPDNRTWLTDKEYNGRIGLCIPYGIYFIKKENMFLDYSSRDKINMDVCVNLFKEYHSYLAEKVKEVEFHGVKYYKYVNKDTLTSAYFEKSFMKFFGKKDNIYISSFNKPAFVTNDEYELLAIIYPYVARSEEYYE